MAIKTRYCPHEPHTHTYRPSKSSREKCCKSCYMAFMEKEIAQSFGAVFVERLRKINEMDLSAAFRVESKKGGG